MELSSIQERNHLDVEVYMGLKFSAQPGPRTTYLVPDPKTLGYTSAQESPKLYWKKHNRIWSTIISSSFEKDNFFFSTLLMWAWNDFFFKWGLCLKFNFNLQSLICRTHPIFTVHIIKTDPTWPDMLLVCESPSLAQL